MKALFELYGFTKISDIPHSEDVWRIPMMLTKEIREQKYGENTAYDEIGMAKEIICQRQGVARIMGEPLPYYKCEIKDL